MFFDLPKVISFGSILIGSIGSYFAIKGYIKLDVKDMTKLNTLGDMDFPDGKEIEFKWYALYGTRLIFSSFFLQAISLLIPKSISISPVTPLSTLVALFVAIVFCVAIYKIVNHRMQLKIDQSFKIRNEIITELYREQGVTVKIDTR